MEIFYNSLNEEIDSSEIYRLSDSLVSLARIKAVEKEFITFVENRVNANRTKISRSKWNYCSKNDNPADIITRFNNCVLNESTFRGGLEQNSWKKMSKKIWHKVWTLIQKRIPSRENLMCNIIVFNQAYL